ncbi:hypothetical protein SDC9_74079 [bioreactor metagenome]|uniref:Uncharacterized protein n=1 Tax=bioreactor metagenome TaxID=1076179 RepID=A0A644YH11_9ZZZZ
MAKCINRDMAVEIEQYFQEKGMEKLNKRSVGVEDSSYIYCYKMNESNKAIIINENSVSGNVMKKYIKNFDKFINGKETI